MDCWRNLDTTRPSGLRLAGNTKQSTTKPIVISMARTNVGLISSSVCRSCEMAPGFRFSCQGREGRACQRESGKKRLTNPSRKRGEDLRAYRRAYRPNKEGK